MELANEVIFMKKRTEYKTSIENKIQYVFDNIIKNVKIDKQIWIIQEMQKNLDLQSKDMSLIKVRSIISNLLQLNGKSISSLNEKYWLKRGWSKKDIKELQLIKKQKRDKSPMTINFWTEKGLSIQEAENQIKSQRKCNKEYWIKKGYNEEESVNKVKEYQKDSCKNLKLYWQDTDYKKEHSINSKLFLSYWINKGYNKKEAKLQLKNRQTTFNLKKCIEKYGEEEGIKRWQERQDKWQNTLNNKPVEERERINKAKVQSHKSFSKISQKLFWDIYNNYPDQSIHFYFAENGTDENNEYMLLTNNNHYRFLDFYSPELNKLIEFDGDYWHGNTRGNKERDEIREKEIKDSIPNIKIYHVKECEYRKNILKTVNDCLEFLNDKTN